MIREVIKENRLVHGSRIEWGRGGKNEERRGVKRNW